ncbi:MAG: hypothetical protein U9P71_02655 [Campylobacterota bacterium]|nr:hypothetical protein [Campylobacterota bacterium]
MKKLFLLTWAFVILFSGCASSAPQVTKVNEIDYPEGISVIVYNTALKKNIEIANARLINGKYKKEAQLIIHNNNSDVNLNISIGSEWTDSRGKIQLDRNIAKRVKLRPHTATRVVLSAPNYKAKDVLINIECGNNCIEKIEKIKKTDATY